MSTKIKISLNKQSIRNAIKELENRKKILIDIIVPEYLKKSAEWIRNRANDILKKSDIGDKVKSWIMNSWKINKISNSHVVLINKSWKAAYVEFGVGIVGETKSHPSAKYTNWKYNIDTEHKDAEGGWIFGIKDSSELDIPENAIIGEEYIEDELAIYTKGTKGVWYLFNALEDFKRERQKSLWIETIIKYWRK